MCRIMRTVAMVMCIAGQSFGIALAEETTLAGALKLMTPAQHKAAFKEYLPLAEQGNAKAQFQIGVIYAYGYGVPQDMNKAAVWYRKSAEQSFAPGQEATGFFLDLGLGGVKRNSTEAFKWFHNAAKEGRQHSQYMVGLMYRMGDGIKEDETLAAEWMRKSALQGNSGAQWELAHMFREGRGVKMSKTEAVMWMRKAAKQGYANAQHDLAHFHGKGVGVKKDLKRSLIWMKLASDAGNPQAKQIWNRVSKSFPENEINKVTRAARTCIQEKFQNCN